MVRQVISEGEEREIGSLSLGSKRLPKADLKSDVSDEEESSNRDELVTLEITIENMETLTSKINHRSVERLSEIRDSLDIQTQRQPNFAVQQGVVS